LARTTRVAVARVFCLVVTLLLTAFHCLSASGQSQEQTAVINREYAIKAAFLYHFSTFVTWPEHVFPGEGKPFVIGIYGSSPFGGALTKIAARKKVDGQAIEVRQVTSVQAAVACQILFVPKSVSLHQQNAVLKATMGLPILTVGDSDGFVERGGSVQFFLEGNKVRFALGEKSHQRDDLRISSKLLSLAKMIPGP
jgi:hypothetical protein